MYGQHYTGNVMETDFNRSESHKSRISRLIIWTRDSVPRGFLSGNLSRFHQHFCGSGLRIIWNGTRNVPRHASWEQGYHGLIIPITREIQNREHFNLGPGTFVSLSLVSRNFNSLFSAPRGPPQQTELRPGVREICVFFIFPLRVFCNPSSSVSPASAAPPSSAFSSVSVFCGHSRGHLSLNVETPTPHQLLGESRREERRLTWSLVLTHRPDPLFVQGGWVMGKMDNFMTQVANNVPMVGSFVLACIQHKINISLIPIWGRWLWPDFKLMRGMNFSSQEKPLIFPSHSQLILDSLLIKCMNLWIWPRFWQDCCMLCKLLMISIIYSLITRTSRGTMK